MSDFIENMELDIEDLTETGRLGYVGGISRILINKLQELDIYKRPLHCTDMKRETLYIKDNDEWEKQTNSKDKMGNIINKVANKNCRNLNKWTDNHPATGHPNAPPRLRNPHPYNSRGLGGCNNRRSDQYPAPAPAAYKVAQSTGWGESLEQLSEMVACKRNS